MNRTTTSRPDGPVPGPPDDRVREVTIPVSGPRVARVLWLVVGLLVGADAVAAVAGARDLIPYTVLRFFDGDSKLNFPTGAKTTLLLAATVLMLCAWAASRRRRDPAALGWALLAAATAFAVVDETTYLHQTLSGVLQKSLGLTGVLKYAWTIVYAPAALVAGVFLLRYLRHLSPPVRRRVLPGGILFVLGALALEPIKSHIADSRGDRGLAFRLTAAASDSLELVGLAMLVTGLVFALSSMTDKLSFTLEPSTPGGDHDPASHHD